MNRVSIAEEARRGDHEVNQVSSRRGEGEFVPTVAQQQEYWNSRWNRTPEPNSWQLRRADKILQLLRGLPIARPRLLDLGCATGWFTAELAKLGDATGIDLSPAAIARARAQYPGVRFEVVDLFEAPLPARSYDVIVAQEVVAHVPDQRRFMEILAAAITPGGYLVISAANRIVMERVDFGPDPREHIKRFLTLRELKNLVRPHLAVLRGTSVIPLGERGFLRLVNSPALNGVLALAVSRRRLEAAKEWAGLGYSVIVLAQRRA